MIPTFQSNSSNLNTQKAFLKIPGFTVVYVLGVDKLDVSSLFNFQKSNKTTRLELAYLFFNNAGRMLRRAKITSNATDWKDNASVVDVNCWRVVPAWIAINEGGATPINVPNQKGLRCTSITGETMLINQFGRNGVIRRKIMYPRRLSFCFSTFWAQLADLSGKYFLTRRRPTK